MNNHKDAIVVKDLVKKYGDFTAVDGISFEVKKGELFGILGQNGAGKTTTLEIIETLKPLTSGEVWVEGFNATDSPWEVKKRIGVQLQSAGFYPELTLVELINMFAALYNVHVDARALLKKVDLEEKAGAYVNKLSGGQKQRFAVMSTLINKPSILFLDEPTTGLDPHARVSLWETIEEIKKSGVTIVLTTHYLEEAEKLCDRVAIMDSGKIIKIGTPNELIKELLAGGFRRKIVRQEATLEDVFLHLTGKTLDE
ncbi:MAG: ATP-binding cassette domain-containing protein [Candidatus Levybacteria bacterium]|nr:ATP-binding cassette domain-containing protein [Candidatus Levybacteria bacterium]